MLAPNRSGNYRFLAAEGMPFSGGVVADDGYDLVHATFERPLPLEAGLAAASHLAVGAGRPVHAIAGFELRIPEPLTSPVRGHRAFGQRDRSDRRYAR